MSNPEDWVVAIPSYRRPGTLRDKTLASLARGGVPADRIHVFVGTDAEADEYRAELPADAYGTVETTGAPGSLMGQRNAIARHWGPGARVVNADDDLKKIRRRVDAKTLEDVTDLAATFTALFQAADAQAASLWGVYPVANPYFMKQRQRVDLTYIVGALYGTTLRHEDHELVTLEDKEDFERTILYYLHDGAVLRDESLTVESAYYTEPGGMQETRTAKRVEDSAHALLARYPALCSLNTGKKSKWAEIKLRDQRGKARTPADQARYKKLTEM